MKSSSVRSWMGLVLTLSACGTSNSNIPGDSIGGTPQVETSGIRASYGLLSPIPTLTLNLDGSYRTLLYDTRTAVELIECVSDSPSVIAGCSVHGGDVVRISAVALSSADATQIHFQVRNSEKTFRRVTIEIAVKGSCEEIRAAGLGQATIPSTYLIHQATDAPGVNTPVVCSF